MTPVTITGAALGLPGTEHIFDDGNIGRILRGDQFIDVIPTRFRRAMLDKHITRLVKNDNGGTFETINNVADVIKLAGRGGAFDLKRNSAFPPSAWPPSTAPPNWPSRWASTHCATPAFRWSCATRPPAKARSCPTAGDCPTPARRHRSDFRSAFPGLDSFADEMARYYADRARREQLAMLESLRAGWRRMAIPLWGRRWRGASTSCAPPSRKSRTSSTGASCSTYLVDGAFAIRRIHRRARPQHANQLRLREHHPSRGAGRGLDPRRAMPPRDRGHLGRRRHYRQSDRMDGRRLPG
jgi:hypothetical protein